MQYIRIFTGTTSEQLVEVFGRLNVGFYRAAWKSIYSPFYSQSFLISIVQSHFKCSVLSSSVNNELTA